MCMKREYLFLSILVPGRNHPKRSLDIFLRPLIEELQELWVYGVQAFDVSTKQNFNLKAVLMWTISDFPALGMLSGWTTHGRLSCPYCMEDTYAFQLKHGWKSSWFDCHQRFLPRDHAYRQNIRSFRKNKVVMKSAPYNRSGEVILHHQLEDIYGLKKTVECGGNCHVNAEIEGYGETHQWHKFSIFWKLPYWKTHLLRHNLDVMHIENFFFDNVINTLLNIAGKTKDSVNSRKDLVLYCDRKPLHLTSFGKAPIPIFRLSANAKRMFLKWLKDVVKFPDGYVSNIGRCISLEQGCKIYGLKSHDCHVIMQRLFPFVFCELLPSEVHEAILGKDLYISISLLYLYIYNVIYYLTCFTSKCTCGDFFPRSLLKKYEYK
ncbi:PREDICTED: uncharacterized protein LOC109125847 [Camelina sativa]|uniref:Uncharacterized protein LOC109125847 n=1 Tax=Camelina sativa TaxID=90675 RepID=A0ABM1QAV2_CAMSA|nr:PREDICTED: uncharacterized protein LOC109125847 [Camelina sativa]